MEEPTKSAPPAASSPAAGWYEVPDHKSHVVAREWDGDVWKDDIRPAPDGATIPHYQRDPVRFLRTPGWIITLVFIVGSGIATYFASRPPKHPHDKRHIAEGIQFLAVPFSFAATVAVLFALVIFLNRRCQFRQVLASRSEYRDIAIWGVISGLVGVGIAIALEWSIPHLFHSNINKEDIWQWIPGPAEELGKILVPVILWFTGRYRLPRQGFLLVVLSGVTFGIVEGTEYAFMPGSFQYSRPVGELMHPLLAGIAAAVAWRFAWGRKSWFTLPGVAALLYVMALHSINDGLIGLADKSKLLGYITPVMFVVLYFSMKFAARQLVPPDNVTNVPPMWRPVPPKRSVQSGFTVKGG